MKAPYWKEMGWENGMYRVSPHSRIMFVRRSAPLEGNSYKPKRAYFLLF
jgi:hypothetical protein